MGKPVVSNRKILWRYEILDRFEAGLVLVGAEVKSLRQGQADLAGSFVHIRGSEAFLVGMKINRYRFDASGVIEPERTRKLLLHKDQISRLVGRVSEKGYTLVPLDVHFNDRGFAKVTLGLGKGKRAPSRKQAKKDRDTLREAGREAKSRGARYKN